MERTKIIVKTSIKAIIVNLILVIFKATVGFAANSIAIVVDAVNNLSDAVSSIITIIGAKLAGKAPDKEHPYGHGRIEYFSSIIIAIIILISGIVAVKESIEKILNPGESNYTITTLVIVVVAILTKLVLGKYVKKIGEKIDSKSLVASGIDALWDSVVSFSTLIAAIINLTWHFSIEGIIGILIACLIIKSGIEILKETINTIIGTRIDGDLTRKIKETINSFEDVQGAYDLILHSYGPTRMIGSVNIQVDDNMTARQIHSLTKRIEGEIYSKYGIVLTMGIYSSNSTDEAAIEIKKELTQIISKYPDIIQLHGFYYDGEKKFVSFDIIVDFKVKHPLEIKDKIVNELKEKYSDYEFFVVLDNDFSD